MRTTPRARGLRLRLAVLTALSLALALLGAVTTPGPARASVSAGDVFYWHNNTEMEQLSGSTVTDLGSGDWPDISPDGSRIAFVGTVGSSQALEVMNSDGSGVTQLDFPTTTNTDDYVTDSYPHWSPDGQWIVFSREETYEDPDGDIQIYKVHPDGSDLTALTSSTGGVDNYWPSWSPDGSQIVFTSNSSSYDQLYIMNADGSDSHLVDASSGDGQTSPVWSPDGSRIYYASTYGYIRYFTSSDGFSGTDATLNYFDSDSISGTGPRLSADGSTLYYSAVGGSTDQIFSVPTDGSGDPTQLTSGDGPNTSPSVADAGWSPTEPSNSAVTIESPSPSDAAFTRQISIGLSSSGIEKYEYGWSTSSSTAPDTSYLQSSTDVTDKTGTLDYRGYWNGSSYQSGTGTDPDSYYYLWIRSVNDDGSPNSWATPLLVHTPEAPVWVAVGDSYTSGQNQPDDQPLCPDPHDDFVWYTWAECTIFGAPDVTYNDSSYSWATTAVSNVNSSPNVPSQWAYTLDLVAKSGTPTSSLGDSSQTPGTTAWADGTTQAASVRADLYARYDSWNIVTVTGGADDTHWVSDLKTWYDQDSSHFETDEPWDVTTSSPSTDCPDSQDVYAQLTASSGALNSAITTNVQGIVTLAATYSPGVRVGVVGYPYIVDSSNDCSGDSGSWHGSKSTIDELNSDLSAVTGSNVKYVDLTTSGNLGSDPITNGYIQLTRFYGYPHPSSDGQSQIASAAIGVLRGSGW